MLMDDFQTLHINGAPELLNPMLKVRALFTFNEQPSMILRDPYIYRSYDYILV